MYSEKLLSRFLEPLHAGEISSPDGVGEEGNITCGDVVQLWIKVEDGLISQASFRAQGCATAIAAADAACELVLGWTVSAAQTLDIAEVSELLGGISDDRLNCATICLGALRSALDQVRTGSLGKV